MGFENHNQRLPKQESELNGKVPNGGIDREDEVEARRIETRNAPEIAPARDVLRNERDRREAEQQPDIQLVKNEEEVVETADQTRIREAFEKMNITLESDQDREMVVEAIARQTGLPITTVRKQLSLIAKK